MRVRALVLLLVALLGLTPTALPGAATGGCGTGSSCCCAPAEGPSLDDGACACGAPTSPARPAPDQAPPLLEGLVLLAPEAPPGSPVPAARDASRRAGSEHRGSREAPTRSALGIWLI